MLLKLLFATVMVSSIGYSQVTLETASRNRILQKYFRQEQLGRMSSYAPERVQQLWDYFANSYTFESSDNPSMDQEYLMNILLFDVFKVEQLRSDSIPVTIQFKQNTQITLKPRILWLAESGIQIPIEQLVHSMPERPFPVWTSSSYTQTDFEAYKKLVWGWAQDFPEQYLLMSSNMSYPHVRFEEFISMDLDRQQAILNAPVYFLID
jgi:hypothetical protein